MRSAAITTAFERNRDAMTLRPSVAKGTATARARMVDGFACEITDGSWTLRADMHPKHGGTDTGPNPGVFLRAALASCLAAGYVRYAAVAGIPITSLEVEVQADYDARGEFGLADMPPGYERVRYVVFIESPAPEAEILAMIEEADAHSSILDDFRRGLDVRRDVRIAAATPD